jgi:colanic acid/amylovoran biosynthesis protein
MRTVGSRVPPSGVPLRTGKRNRPYETLRVVDTTASVSTQAANGRTAMGVVSDTGSPSLVPTRSTTTSRILITDTVALNTGDAAILLGTMRTLRAAFGDAVDIEIADSQPKAASRYYPELRFLPTVQDALAAWTGKSGLKFKLGSALLVAAAATWRLGPFSVLKHLLPPQVREVLAHYAAADVIVAAGGTYLVPHYRLAPRLVHLLTCMALGKPLIMFTQSMGPFEGRLTKALLRFVLRRSALILLRDDLSRRHLQALGVPPDQVAVAPDAAFALAPANINHPTAAKANGQLKVAISLRDWPHFETGTTEGMEKYLDAVAGLVRRLVSERKAHVTFLSTCQGTLEYWTDDSAIADQVTRRLPPDILCHVEVDRMHRRPENMIRRLKDFDAVVATRMHAAILALCAGRPVLAIAYEFKSRELFRRLGMGELVVDIEEATTERLVDAVDRLLDTRAQIVETVATRVAAERHAALAVGNLVRRAVHAAGVPLWRTR